MDNVAHCRHFIGPVPDGEGKSFRLRLQHLRVHRAPHEILEELLPQQGQTVLVGLGKLADVPALLDLLVQYLPYPVQNGGELGGVHRLEDILHYIELDGLLGILKLVKTGENDEFQIGLAPGELRTQLQPVHKGHLDVGEDHIQL